MHIIVSHLLIELLIRYFLDFILTKMCVRIMNSTNCCWCWSDVMMVCCMVMFIVLFANCVNFVRHKHIYSYVLDCLPYGSTMESLFLYFSCLASQFAWYEADILCIQINLVIYLYIFLSFDYVHCACICFGYTDAHKYIEKLSRRRRL